MADETQTVNDLSQLGDAIAAAGATAAADASGDGAAAPVENTTPSTPTEPVIDELGRSYATGRRKSAVARVWIKRGNGSISVNGKDLATYFGRPVLQMIVQQPFGVAHREGEFDVVCTVRGGGPSGQAGAVRHGISQAMTLFEPALRPVLKSNGFLTRDSRKVERKKYGRAKARRSFQFSKR